MKKSVVSIRKGLYVKNCVDCLVFESLFRIIYYKIELTKI